MSPAPHADRDHSEAEDRAEVAEREIQKWRSNYATLCRALVLAKRDSEAAEAERDRARSLAATLEARLAQVEALASAVVHAWDNAAPVEPCDACRGHGFVELWTFEDEKRMDEAVDEFRAALKGDA